MIKNIRVKSALLAAAAVGGLITVAPTASAAGNCVNYGQPGYVQFFTGPNYTGNCYEEYYYNPVSNFASVGYSMNDNISSFRSWYDPSAGSRALWSDPYGKGVAFTFSYGQSSTTLPSWIDNKASSLY